MRHRFLNFEFTNSVFTHQVWGLKITRKLQEKCGRKIGGLPNKQFTHQCLKQLNNPVDQCSQRKTQNSAFRTESSACRMQNQNDVMSCLSLEKCRRPDRKIHLPRYQPRCITTLTQIQSKKTHLSLEIATMDITDLDRCGYERISNFSTNPETIR